MRYQEVTEARCYCYRTWKLLGMGLENGCFFLPGSGSRGPCRYDVHNRYVAVVHSTWKSSPGMALCPCTLSSGPMPGMDTGGGSLGGPEDMSPGGRVMEHTVVCTVQYSTSA